jgi:hypothetical protein
MDTPRGTAYTPLTEEQIEELREYTRLNMAPRQANIETLCDMAVNALLYAREIQRLRGDVPASETQTTAQNVETAGYSTGDAHPCDIPDKSGTETAAEVALQAPVEEWLRGLSWGSMTPEDTRTLVAGNVRAFYAWLCVNGLGPVPNS